MSGLEISQTPTDSRQKNGPARGRSWAAVALAVIVAITVVAAALRVEGDLSPLILILLALAGFAGLLLGFAALAGFIHIGRLPKERVFFDALMDAMNEACLVCDARGRAVYANAAYDALLKEAAHGRLVGVENLYTGFPEVSERIYRLSQSAREAKPHAEEFRLSAGSAAAGARADRPTWLRLSVTPVTPASGAHYVLWRIADISSDRERQESAFSNLQYIINYLDNAPAGFFSTASDGRIAYVNATLAGWLGLDLARTSNGSLALDDLVGKDNAALLLAIQPEPGAVRTESFELDLPADGERLLPVRIIHRTDYDEAGNAQPSRSLVLDRRTDMLSGEDAAKAEMQLARFFNNAPVGIAQLDAEGVIEKANAVFVQLSSKAQRGAPVWELVQPDQQDAVRAALQGAKVGASMAEPVDVTFAGPSQHTGRIYFYAVEPDLAANGEEPQGPASAIVFAIDTTRHSSLEAQLAQGQKMQAVGQLAGGVAHDFNNVLTAIIGFSDLLLAKHRPTDPSFADIMNIKQNATRAANLVRQLLAFSRRQTLRPEILSLTDVISDLGNLLGRLLGERVELKVVHGRDVGMVKIDVNQFEQVIINLAVNARDAMPNGGTLSVRTANVSPQEAAAVQGGVLPDGDYVLCEVSDTGSGMPPEVLEKIYEPFFSTKEVGKGTGLGLSTVYGIVKQTGGFIFCDSEVGKGTTFRIYLPRHAPEEGAEDGAEEAAGEKARRTDLTGTGTILLVEDEDAVRSFASRALAARGYTVLEAESGETALEIVDKQDAKIDLVLSDVVMPEMDGPTLLKELRKRGVDTKVVFISGYAEDAFEKNLEGQRDFAFLPKPFTFKQLAEAVKEAMA